MFPSLCVVLFTVAINLQHVKGYMVESVDGSFVPWSFEARAPGDPIAVRMINNYDLSYLVSLYRYTSLLSADQIIGNCHDGLVLVFCLVPTLSHSLVIPCIGTPAQQILMAVSLSQNFVSVESPPGGVSDPS